MPGTLPKWAPLMIGPRLVGLLAIALLAPRTRAESQAIVRPTSANPLVGYWRQSGWKFCTPVARLTAEQMDPPIDELWFRSDGTFTVTWVPFERYKDYWGHYTYDESTGALELAIEHGNYVPRDFVGKGTAKVEGQRLTLDGVRLGTKKAKNRPEVCQLTFSRG